MSPPREPSTPQAALYALVIELFSADELRRWLRHSPNADLLPEVPEGGSLAELAERTLAALERRGRIDAAFFERLEAERPQRKAAVAAVAERWASSRGSTEPTGIRGPPVPRSSARRPTGAARIDVEGDFVAGSKTVHNHYHSAPPGAPAASAGPTAPATRTTAPTATASTSTSERVLAAWVHVSDLHFGHGDPGRQWNQVRVLDELLSDVCELVKAQKVPAPGLILVTGDVAFSGGARPTATGKAEYALAAEWLGRLGAALGVAKERVFVVPGNHDVDRGVDRDKDTAGMVKLARYGDDGHTLDDALNEATGIQRLRSRQAGYLAFAAGFGPRAGTSTPAPLWWEHPEPLAEDLTLRLCGLNTALLAAKDDKGRLRVGEQQLAKLLRVTAPTELTVVLAHHPAAGGWLADEKELDGALDERAVAYLSGHVHEARSVQVHKGAGEGCLHVSAGAAHAEAASTDAPPASHGYNVGALVVLASGELAVRIWPRRWSLASERPRFEVDTANTRKNEIYAEHRLGERYRLALPDPRSGLHPGDLLGQRYRLVETLGQGGVGQVWKAEDTYKRGEAVAVKVLNADGNPSPPHRRELFFRGPESMRKVAHPAIVKIIDPNPDPGHRHGPYDFYVMAFVPGTNLSKRFKGRGCGEAQAIEVILKIAEGLATAHARGVIHRDLKPSNVLLGDDGRITIVDFDTVKDLEDTTRTRSDRRLVTDVYASPEVLDGEETDGRADVYSLALTGAFLVSGGDPPRAYKNLTRALANLKCSPALREVLTRACTQEAKERYSSMAAFSEALRGLSKLDDAPTKVASPPKPNRDDTEGESRPGLASRISSAAPTSPTATSRDPPPPASTAPSPPSAGLASPTRAPAPRPSPPPPGTPSPRPAASASPGSPAPTSSTSAPTPTPRSSAARTAPSSASPRTSAPASLPVAAISPTSVAPPTPRPAALGSRLERDRSAVDAFDALLQKLAAEFPATDPSGVGDGTGGGDGRGNGSGSGDGDGSGYGGGAAAAAQSTANEGAQVGKNLIIDLIHDEMLRFRSIGEAPAPPPSPRAPAPSALPNSAPPRLGKRWLPVGAGAGLGALSVVVALVVNAAGSCQGETTPPPGMEASAGAAAPEVKPEKPDTPPMRCPKGQVAEGTSCVARCPDGTEFIEGGSFGEHTIGDFCMDITEVTVAAFRAQASAESFEKARTRHFEGVTPKGDVWCNARHSDRDAHPINCVDWEQAEAHCKSQGNRLPTEWEWEWAARGRDKGWKYPWGNDEPRAELVNACGSECVKEAKRVLGSDWKSMYSDDDGHASTAPVGSKPAGKSWDKLQDMAGNVWEWTSSSEGDKRVLRGGGWNADYPVYLSASSRLSAPPSTRSDDAGFRCARTAR